MRYCIIVAGSIGWKMNLSDVWTGAGDRVYKTSRDFNASTFQSPLKIPKKNLRSQEELLWR